MDKILKKHYYDPRRPGSFTSVRNLKRYSGLNKKKVLKFLRAQDAYTTHKPTRVRFPRRRTYAKGIDDLFQADLVDVGKISKYNDGYRYVLTCIDVFSKRAWGIALKTKSGSEVTLAFEKILTDRKCNMLQTDKGTEWLNSKFQTMLRRNNIKFYTSENDDIKAAVVERFNRTLKSRMWRYFTYKNTRRFLDVLPDLIHSYNNTYHSSIRMKPVDVDRTNEDLVRNRLYPIKQKKLVWKYLVGDRVRISMHSQPFEKGYEGNWSEELFVVSVRHPTEPVTYGISDLSGEDIKGKFYELELQKVSKRDNEVFVVEKILKTRKRGGKIEYLVKWRSYPNKFNSWVDDVRNPSQHN
jgi:transposase InsO family protein